MKFSGGSNKKKAPKPEKETNKKSTAPKSAKAKAPKEKKSEGATAAKITTLVLCIIVVLLAAAAAGGVYYVSTIDEIYPNVSLDGHDLGGMSATEAAAELDKLGYASQEGEEVNVFLLRPVKSVPRLPLRIWCSVYTMPAPAATSLRMR